MGNDVIKTIRLLHVFQMAYRKFVISRQTFSSNIRCFHFTIAMKILLKIEEAMMFLLALFFFHHLDLSWWWFIGCILLPDLGMIGYLFNAKAGAFLYNLFHHKGVAVVIGIAGFYLQHVPLEFTGIILFAHAAMDRMFGYGLKYEQGFRFTHLGIIGKEHSPERI